ncbi:MAG: phage tail tape measure protein, partial [Fusobacteriaceae bacterium]
MSDFKLQGEVVLDDNGFKSKLNDLKSEGEKFGSSFKNSMFGSMTAANLAAKGVELLMSTLRSAVNEFGLLDKNLAKVNTVIDKQAGSITNLRMELLKISTETGIFASELANASYEALSAGVATETLGEFINQAAILSQAGFLSTTQAVNVLTSVMGAYGKEVLTVEQISNKLVTAQANGKFTIDDLAKSMSSVTPIAASLGVSLDEVLASISAITMTGASASEATTRLRAALSVLSSGSSNVSIAFKEMTGKT